EEQKRLHDEKRSVVTEEDADRAIKDVEANILTSPDKLLNYLKLAELHRRKRAWEKAKEALRRGLAVAPQNAQILAALGELAVVRRQAQLEEIRQKLAASPDDEKLKAEIATLDREALDFEIEEVERALRASPLSGETRLRLGELYLRAERIDDAVATFQKCVNDPRRRLRVLLRLGQAFSAKGMHQLAARQFETVVNETEVMNDLKKEATYELARALEAAGSLAEALARYQTVYEVDIGYRDVASRVETLYNQIKDSPQV
ncbi:MAG: tetratricopeptide repeat protein, partial [Planctomycetota bacterium]